MPSADNFRAIHVKEDLRDDYDSDQSEGDYPWLIYHIEDDEPSRSVMETVIIEFEVIGLQSNANKGADLVKQISDALIGEFKGTRKTWGKFDEEGNADPSGGVQMSASFLGRLRDPDTTLDEIVDVMRFRFARPAL